jgi:hypothetical protein
MQWIKAFVGIWKESRDGVEGATKGTHRARQARHRARRQALAFDLRNEGAA